MLKTLMALTGASVVLIGAALADVPDDSEACFKTADEVADAVEEAQLTEEEMETVDDLLFRIEEHCAAEQFREAIQVAESVRALIADRR
jgi:hypothetical protein